MRRKAATLHIGIASRAQMKTRTLAVARGAHKRAADEPKHLDGVAGVGPVDKKHAAAGADPPRAPGLAEGVALPARRLRA